MDENRATAVRNGRVALASARYPRTATREEHQPRLPPNRTLPPPLNSNLHLLIIHGANARHKSFSVAGLSLALLTVQEQFNFPSDNETVLSTASKLIVTTDEIIDGVSRVHFITICRHLAK